MKTRVFLIGPIPPPTGGVSVHISRLAQQIRATDDLDCFVFDPGRFRFFERNLKRSNLLAAIIFFLRCDIVHIHISNKWKVLIARLAKVVGKKVVYTRHNIRNVSSREERRIHELTDVAINVSTVPSDLQDKKTFIIPAYIPAILSEPVNDKLKDKLKSYDSVIAAISSHPLKQPVLMDGKDLYGFDLLLKAYNSENGKQVLLLLDPSGAMEDLYRTEVKKLNESGRDVIYLTEDIDFLSLVELLTVYVRPTRSDGDSIVVREALGAGVNVVASDCVGRPNGVLLFSSGDVASLADVLKKAIQERKVEPEPQPDFSRKVLDLYRSLKNHA